MASLHGSGKNFCYINYRAELNIEAYACGTSSLICSHVYLSLSVVLPLKQKSASSMRHNRGTICAYAWLVELVRADSLNYVSVQLVRLEHLWVELLWVDLGPEW